MSGPVEEWKWGPPWLITLHAIERYIERVEPRATFEEAIAALEAQLPGAHRIKEIRDGLELWRGPKPRRVRFRVRPTADRLELVTVLPAFDR